MNWYKKIISIIASILICTNVFSQELNSIVTINSDQITGTNKSAFIALQTAITEFINERTWTDFNVQSHERIDCNFQIIINSQSNSSYSAELQIRANRPVYNSSYKTPIFSFNDKEFAFVYNENDNLSFDESSFGNNLTEVLAYYIYIIIGKDCDSFSKFGGTAFYKKAETIVNQAQSTNQAGWKAFESHKNRYALISNLLDENLKPFREYYYTYHRLGLDEMSISADKSRDKIVNGLSILSDLYRQNPSAIIITEFVNTKLDELINIYSTANTTQKNEAYETLMYVAPTLQNRIDLIKK